MDSTALKPEKIQRLASLIPGFNSKEFTSLKLWDLNVKYDIVISINVYKRIYIFDAIIKEADQIQILLLYVLEHWMHNNFILHLVFWIY